MILILAENMRQGRHLAGLLELRGRDYRYVNSGRDIDGARFTRAYVHPMFWERRDKWAILDAVRRATYRDKNVEVVELRQDAIDALEENRRDSESTRDAAAVLAGLP